MAPRAAFTLSILICSWSAASHAGFVQPLFSAVTPVQAQKLGFSPPSLERTLCISPCFSLGVEAYIGDAIFMAGNGASDLFTGLLPKPNPKSDLKSGPKSGPKSKPDRNPSLNPDPDLDPTFGLFPFNRWSITPNSSGSGEEELPVVTTGELSQLASVNPVPVPATLALFGLGLAGLGWSRRKKA